MRISESKASDLYKAIGENIIDVRIDIARKGLTDDEIDERLFRLESIIWRDVKKALNIKE